MSQSLRAGGFTGCLCLLRLLFVWVVLVVNPAVAFTQASPYVDLFDPIYRDIEKLVAFDVVDDLLFATRPFTRMDIARALLLAETAAAEFRSRSDTGAGAFPDDESSPSEIAAVERVFRRWAHQYDWELKLLKQGTRPQQALEALAHQVVASWMFANARSRPIPNNGLGIIDAEINPLLQNKGGRHLVDGHTISLESSHSLAVSGHLAFTAQPRLQFGVVRGTGADVNEFAFQRLSGVVTLGNFRVVVGREQELWGQGRNAGLLISRNVRGLDMIKVENDRAIRLPWLLRYLGPTKLKVIAADLGADQTFPHAKLLGYSVSFLPWPTLEVGAGILAQIGGEGAPDAPFLKRIQDLVPFVENIFGRTWGVPSNKEAAFNARMRIPSLRGLTFYLEGAIEDIDFDLGEAMFWETAAYLVGVSLPRLSPDGRASIVAEFMHTGPIMYRHFQYVSGFTQNRFILGNNLGPDGKAAHLYLSVDVTETDLLEFQAVVEGRRADMIRRDYPEFIREEIFPTEKRYRLIGSWQHWSGDRRLSMGLNLGVERVTNFDFQDGIGRTNTLCEVFLRFNP